MSLTSIIHKCFCSVVTQINVLLYWFSNLYLCVILRQILSQQKERRGRGGEGSCGNSVLRGSILSYLVQNLYFSRIFGTPCRFLLVGRKRMQNILGADKIDMPDSLIICDTGELQKPIKPRYTCPYMYFF